ncbi:MAG: efflux RND transporter periplasmic adaptor subunit, partial [Polaribacter sp.]
MKKYKNYLIIIAVLVLGIIIGTTFSGGKNASKEHKHDLVQDPITKLWTCSMHPQIRMEKPGNCPICGMELIPLEGNNTSKESISASEIVMTPEAIQLANIQTTVVKRAKAIKEIRLLGRVKPDERRLYSQVSHIPGRIERLYLNFTGEKVSKGQRIVRLYSPDLITAQKELFEAIRSRDIYPQLYTASRNKLKLWKLSNAQINAIEKSGKVSEQVDIYSDYSGYVLKRHVELGDHIMAGSNLFDIANLSSVWVMFEAYESDIPWIHVGDQVDFTIQAIPEKSFKGKITYVDPFVSPSTRVAKIRVEVKNGNQKLLPEMYATGIIKAKLKQIKEALIIPKSAVLWTGKRSVVYVKVPHKKTISFTYRKITLGQDMGQFYIVAHGLEEGETVATNGVFRIDASAQLLGKQSMMNPTDAKGNTEMNGNNANKKETSLEHSQIKRLKTPKQFKKQLQAVFEDYLTLKNDLVEDKNNAAKTDAKKILESMTKIDMKLLTNSKAHTHW